MFVSFRTILLLTTVVVQIKGQFRSPIITEHPADLLVPRNEPATLNCHAEGRPDPTISWYKDGKKFSSSSRHVLLKNGDLFFLRVLQTKKEDDTGVYWCQATNDVGTVKSKNATLEIAILRDEFKAVPEDTQIAEGATAILRCLPPKGHPEPVVVWLKDEVELDPATEHRYKLVDQGSLAINGVRVSDSGKYICQARNVYATKKTDVAYLTVQVPPHLVSFTDEVTGAAGGTLELVCRVGGDPLPEVYWERTSPGELPVERMTQEERGQVLRIRHAEPEDEGSYSCRAENPVGAVTSNISLKVHSRPVISKVPEDVRVALNGVATFVCEATGSPPPTSYWIHEGQGVVLEAGQTSDGGRISVDSQNTLTVKGVEAKDRGFYVCTTVGIAGSAIARAHLEVLDTSDLPPPLIALGAPNQTLPLGTEGEMPCDARGTPEPKIEWFVGDVPFEQTKRSAITPFGTLRITSLRLSDTGMYTCKAISTSGTSAWTVSLTVAKPTNPNVAFFKRPHEGALPEPPGHVTVLNVNVTTITLGWRRGRPGSSQVLGYTVQMWSPDLRGPWVTALTKPLSTSAMPVSVAVTGLKSNTRYVFVVRASNSHGLSRPSETTHMVKTHVVGNENEVHLHQIRSRLAAATIKLSSVDAFSATALKLSWQLLVDVSLLEGVYIRYRSIDVNKRHPTGPLSMETVFLKNKENFTGHTLTELRPGTGYEVFVVPFYQSVEGQPSAAMRAKTLDAPPTVAPTGLHYSSINGTTVRLTWDPISEHTANGRIIAYSLHVLDVTQGNTVHLNTSIGGTWALVGGLQAGSVYHATIRGVTASGAGPFSVPIAFSVASEGFKSFPNPTAGPSVPSSNVESNNYIILIIVCAAIFLFGSLFLSVYFIYRKRKNSKCPTYLSKAVDEKGVWSDYPRSWNDTTKSFCMTSSLYTEGGSQGGPISHFLQHPSESMGKEGFNPRSNDSCYDERQPDNLYEDPDGLRLVSFTERNDQRCFSPAPYATTTLLSSDSSDLLSRLPPNIPIQDLLMGSSADKEKLESLACLQNNEIKHYATYNFNSNYNKDSSRSIVQIPVDNLSDATDENQKNLAMSTFNPEFASAYLLQQHEVPFSYTGSVSVGSLRSQGSTFGRPFLVKASSNRGGFHSSFVNGKDYEGKMEVEVGYNPALIGDGSMTLRTRKAKQQMMLLQNQSQQQSLTQPPSPKTQQQLHQEQKLLQDINDLFLQKNANVQYRRRTSSLSNSNCQNDDYTATAEPLLSDRISPRSSTFGDSEGSDGEDDSASSTSSRPLNDHRQQIIDRDVPNDLFSIGNNLIWGDGQLPEGPDTNSAFDTGPKGDAATNHKRRRSKGGGVNDGRNSFSLAMTSPLI